MTMEGHGCTSISTRSSLRYTGHRLHSPLSTLARIQTTRIPIESPSNRRRGHALPIAGLYRLHFIVGNPFHGGEWNANVVGCGVVDGIVGVDWSYVLVGGVGEYRDVCVDWEDGIDVYLIFTVFEINMVMMFSLVARHSLVIYYG